MTGLNAVRTNARFICSAAEISPWRTTSVVTGSTAVGSPRLSLCS